MPKRGQSRDLKPATVAQAHLDLSDPGKAFLGLRQFAEDNARETIDWYLRGRRLQGRLSKALTLATLLLAAFGGLLPMFGAASIALPLLGPPATYNLYGYIAFAGAGACLIFDRLFGFSSAWMRYITTSQTLQRKLEAFDLAWLAVWLKVDKGQPDADQQEELLDLLRRFRLETLEVVEKETQTWIAEFSRNLVKLDGIARAGRDEIEATIAKKRRTTDSA
ncbi:MAG: SLATT domain-containing protein [Nannocystaceae bacterium]